MYNAFMYGVLVGGVLGIAGHLLGTSLRLKFGPLRGTVISLLFVIAAYSIAARMVLGMLEQY